MTASAAERLRVGPVSSTERISPPLWDGLAVRGAQLQAWSVAAERCGWHARHVTVSEGGAAQLIVPAYFVTRADHDLHDRWLGPLRQVVAGIGMQLRPTLAVGTPFVQTSAPIGELDGVPDATLERVFDSLEECARQDGARAIVWPFVGPGCERLIRLARGRGYLELYAGASAFLPVEWNTFDQYLRSRSKHLRRIIHADLRAFDDGGFHTEIVPDFGAHASAMDALFRSVFQRRNGHASMLPRDFFREVAARAEPGISAQLTWDGSRLVGMSLKLVAGGVMDGTFAAVAPEHEGGPVYYNNLIYLPLRTSWAQGVRRLELGPSALRAKILRGAKLYRRVGLIRGTTPGLHALLGIWGRRVAARTEEQENALLAPLGGFRCFE